MNADGYVVIETQLDTKPLDDKMTKLENKLKNSQAELDIKFGDVENAKKELQEVSAEFEIIKKKHEDHIKLLKRKQDEYDVLNEKIASNQALSPDEYATYGRLENSLSALKREQNAITAEYNKQNDAINKVVDKLDNAELKYQKQKTKVQEITAEFQRMQKQQESSKFDGIVNSIKNIGKETEKSIKKVGRWALAIFGIRSAYLAIRKAASTLSQYNEQIKTDLSYFSFAIASALQPVIERLIQLAYQLLTYINKIAYAWFGINLFANATTDAFKKANTGANTLKKTLAGFDEMNIVSDNSGGGGGSAMPSMDLSQSLGGNTPGWLQWIIDHKDELIGAILGIQGAFISLKLLGLDPIESSGVFLIIFGLYNLIKDIIDVFGKVDGSLEDNGTSFEDWGNIIRDVGAIVAGLGLLILGLPAIIAGTIIAIIGILMKYWDNIKTWFGDRIQEGKNIFGSFFDWILQQINNTDNDIIKGLWRFLGEVYNIFLIIPNLAWNLVQTLIDTFSGLFGAFKQIFDGILLLFKGDFVNGFVNIGKGLVNILITLLNTVIGIVASVWNAILAAIQRGGDVFGFNWDLSGARLTWRIPYLRKGGIINNPGQGVPVGQAIGGEAGKEGVIPLTDSQQMALLGESIGKYITINLTNVNEMNGRVLSREIKRLENQDNFAFNR